MKFSQRFTNIDINIDEARKRFANRVLYVLFPRYPILYGRELQLVSRALGEMITKIQRVEDIIHNDFYRILDMLERLVDILHENATNTRNNITASRLADEIQKELNDADIDLEVEWRDGKFFPRGAKLLDHKLVDDPLEWLHNLGYTSVLRPFRKSLDHFLHSRSKPSLLLTRQ